MNSELKIFETHAHYDDNQFDEDRHEILSSMVERGVEYVVNIAANLRGCQASIELAHKYNHVYATVGVHPDEVGELDEITFERLRRYCDEDKVVAVGEIGLDYYWDNEGHDVQEKWFIEQLNLAREKNLPVVIHSRDATEDTLRVIREHGSDLKGVIHCFSSSAEVAKEYVKMGFYIGIGGVVTFKNARVMKEVVEAIPLTSIVLETDAPYLAPTPFRGKRNESTYLQYVAEEIAKIKEISYQEVIQQTSINGKVLYGI